MIVQFKVKNFLSLRDEQTLSMVVQSGLKEKLLDADRNVIAKEDQKFLKSAVIYGANASGKSNLIKALASFWYVFTQSIQSPAGIPIPIASFALNTETVNEPTMMEMIFHWQDHFYRYGFEVTPQEVKKEWLYLTKDRETKVFVRDGNQYDIGAKHKILKLVQEQNIVASNALFLAKATILNDPMANEVHSWLKQFHVVSGIYDSLYLGFTLEECQIQEKKNSILELLKIADFGIEDFEIREQEGQGFNIKFDLKTGSSEANVDPAKSKLPFAVSLRKVMNAKGEATQPAVFNLEQQESEGTKKFFHLSGPILNALKNGNVFIIDELDTKLHPLLTERIIELFHSPKTNTGNAQLIFATHDTNLLSAHVFRRDQIWFTEKKKDGSTELYSLSDFKKGKKPRNDLALEKNYLMGKFGGIPYLNQFDAMLESE
ncbi:ATP-binding protein [bacterium]|nr:ATP-binding protein [bacterium]NUN44647.1 ATP-binding protein [bacterium]